MTSRRTFLKSGTLTAIGAATAFTIVPRHVLGRGFVAPSDKLNMAAVGCGGRAAINIQLAINGGTDNLVALCDVDDRQAATYRAQFPKAPYFRDYREMLDKAGTSIDAVIVSTPDHMHAPVAMAAMNLGKHVYVEKPLAHDIHEVRMLTEAARRHKVVTQMGNQGSSGDSTRYIETLIQDKVIGPVHTVYCWTNRLAGHRQTFKDGNQLQPVPAGVDRNKWLGTAPHRDYHPAYLPTGWRGYWDFGTGALGDMGCHIMDVPFRALKLGYPLSVECSVGSVYATFSPEAFFDDVFPPSTSIHLTFPSDDKKIKEIRLSWFDGGLRPSLPEGVTQEQMFANQDGGMLFMGTKGMLSAGLFGDNYKLLPDAKFADYTNGRTQPVPIRPLVEGGADGHQQQWVKACKQGYGAYTSSSFDQAGPLTETVLMGNLATRSYLARDGRPDNGQFPGRKKLLWDGDALRITNFDYANQFVKRDYANGYTL